MNRVDKVTYLRMAIEKSVYGFVEVVTDPFEMEVKIRVSNNGHTFGMSIPFIKFDRMSLNAMQKDFISGYGEFLYKINIKAGYELT